jgi:hypothetical protein
MLYGGLAAQLTVTAGKYFSPRSNAETAPTSSRVARHFVSSPCAPQPSAALAK